MIKETKTQRLNYDSKTIKYLYQIQIGLIILSILAICLAVYLIIIYSSDESGFGINEILQIILNFLIVFLAFI